LKPFEYQHAGQIIFGNGRIGEVGSVVSRFGQRCLIVSGPRQGPLGDLYPIVGELLEHLGLQWKHFDGVRPNPAVDLISAGANLARTFSADVILGIGGGSSLDTAKAISLEVTHQGTSWDDLFHNQRAIAPTLPVVAVGTTAGSGSQVNPTVIISDPKTGEMSAFHGECLIPRVAIVDPQLMLSVPAEATAGTGFSILCRAFESTLPPLSNPLTEILAWEAVSRVIKNLPLAVRDGSNLSARSSLALADTLAGLATSGTGIGLSQGIAMTLGAVLSRTAYGLVFASVYRAFLKYSCASAVSSVATLARLLDPGINDLSSAEAAERCPDLLQSFLSRIGLTCTLRDFGVAKEELLVLARQSTAFTDYKNNPSLPSPEQMLKLISDSY
jgi:alcohol dehydrogenase class IV